MTPRIWTAAWAGLLALSTLRPVMAGGNDSSSNTRWITYQAPDGSVTYLQDDRQPALYTQDFGDCLGNSLINVTRFDAAYYQDNMTVLFHLAGNTALVNQSLMMYIGVYAYGQSRFDLTFNPCLANIMSMCPVNAPVPITASGFIPVSVNDVSNIPAVAYSIPDFEGEAVLRIFANSTQSEIGCYSAVVTNGHTFSQPASVGTVLGIFTVIALVASFATATYGEAVPTMRLHYAHSLSVGVVIAVFQHIFFTGALSMNWPSVLVAWWSNFAWAGGMIYSSSMQSSINHLLGNNYGNTSQVGAAPTGSSQETLGGGYDLSKIYRRAFTASMRYAANHPLKRDVASEIFTGARNIVKRVVMQKYAERTLRRRDLANSTTGYMWYGHAVVPGLPLPGNYSGFAGTLAQEGIRASDAFMTGFLWFLVLLALLVTAVVAFKWFLEGLARFERIKQERLKFFRDHWLGYSAAVALRTCYLAFFMMMFLTIFEFTYQSSGGVKGIAAIVFVIFVVGIPGMAVYACLYKNKVDVNNSNPQTHSWERKKLLGFIPWASVRRVEPEAEGDVPAQDNLPESSASSRPFWRRMRTNASVTGSITREDGIYHSIHDDEDYTMKFGWLAGRFRRTRWWFFTVWIFYEFVRAIFYAGCAGYPLAQVFGLLVIEFVAFIYLIWAKPFEGRRLNVLVVYCLGFSKVATVALSAAFDVQFNLQRITTTVIGIVIIVIQGILTVITMIAIIVGAISSYMSVTRNQEDFHPRKWAGLREKYFDHLDRAVNDLPPEPRPKRQPREQQVEEEAKEPYFEMKSVRRMAKIEDEDEKFAGEFRPEDPAASYLSLQDRASTPGAVGSAYDIRRSSNGTPVRSRAPSVNSMSATNLPFGARPHRPSWNTKDFNGLDAAAPPERSFTPVDMTRHVPEDDPVPNQPPPPPPPAAVVAGGKGHKATSSRSATAAVPSAPLRPQISSDGLKIGGDTSTRDTIGNVPMPATRPRAGTYGSLRSSGGDPFAPHRISPEPGSVGYHALSGYDDAAYAGAGGGVQRGSKAPVLTPAMEMDEWKLSPRLSRGQ